MFGLSFWEIGIILGIALIVLGPTKLPELARSLGKGIREFRKATEDFKSTVDDEMHKPDPPKRIEKPRSEEVAELLPADEEAEVAEAKKAKLDAEIEKAAADAVEAAEADETVAREDGAVERDVPAKKKPKSEAVESNG